MKKHILLSFIFLFIFPVFIFGCGKKENIAVAEKNKVATGESLTEVIVEDVKQGPIFKTYTSVGTVTPKDSTRIFPKVAGRIHEVLVEEGDKVNKGDLLMQIDTIDYIRAVENQNAMMNQANTGLSKAHRDFARAEKLFKDKAVSKQIFQDAKTALEMAEFTYDQAANALKKVKDDIAECSVKAPISGMITNKYVNPGELVSPQVLAFVIMQMGMVEVEVNLPEEAFGYISTGNKSFATFDAIPNANIEGVITKIHPTIDPLSRTMKITITINNPDLKIRTGMTARTKIVQKAKENALFIPRTALIHEEDHYVAYRVNSEKVEKLTISTGIIGDDVAEIKSGVEKGDQLVVKGITGLKNGMKIKIVADKI